ncbi:MAG: transposase [Okeania sp. SIO2F4]|nr:transposase [Okeania sp. SIO2F4]
MKLIIVNKWFPISKTYSKCGNFKESLSLSERIFNCSKCGFSCDRYLNGTRESSSGGQ